MFEDFASLQPVMSSFGCAGFWEADYTMGRLRTTGSLTWLYGLRPDQGPSGASWSDVDRAFHPEDLDMIRRIRRFPSAMKSGAHVIRFRLIDPNGQIRHLEAHSNALVDGDGLLRSTKGLIFETKDATGHLQAGPPVAASLVELDRLSATLLQSYRQARDLGLADVEAELKPTLTRVMYLLKRKFRPAVLH